MARSRCRLEGYVGSLACLLRDARSGVNLGSGRPDITIISQLERTFERGTGSASKTRDVRREEGHADCRVYRRTFGELFRDARDPENGRLAAGLCDSLSRDSSQRVNPPAELLFGEMLGNCDGQAGLQR